MEEFKPATPLLNFFDLDPERLKPMSYEATIDVPVAVNGLGVSSVTIRNQPFILSRIKHRILGNTGDPETSGLYDDGQTSARGLRGVKDGSLAWGCSFCC